MQRLRPGVLATTAVVAAGAAVVCWVLAASNRPAAPWEGSTGRFVFDLSSSLTRPLELVMQFGTRGAVVVVALGLVLARRYRGASVAALGGAAAWLTSTMLKEVVERPRPGAAVLGRAARSSVEGHGFPSTHAAIAAALAVALAVELHHLRAVVALGALAAVLTMTARVHLGVHWPLDVLGGAALGLACGAGIAAVVEGSGDRWR